MRFIIFSFLAALLACNNSSEEVYTDESLMGYPPYQLLTDSLQKKPTAEMYYRRGQFCFATESYRSAYYDYSRSFKLHPSALSAEAVVSCLYQLEKYDSVILFVKEQQKHFRPNRVNEILSTTYEKTGNYTEALKYLEEQAKTEPENAYLIYQRAVLLEDLNDTAGAILNYERTLEMLPNFPNVKFNLANLYAESGNARALKLCDDMIKDTASFHAEPYYLQGVYYSKTLQPGKAYESFNKAIGKDWKYIDAYIDKGKVQFMNKDYTTALKTFEVALSVSNADADVYYWIGRCKEALGQKEEAIDYYRKTLGLDDGYDNAKDALKRLGQ